MPQNCSRGSGVLCEKLETFLLSSIFSDLADKFLKSKSGSWAGNCRTNISFSRHTPKQTHFIKSGDCEKQYLLTRVCLLVCQAISVFFSKRGLTLRDKEHCTTTSFLAVCILLNNVHFPYFNQYLRSAFAVNKLTLHHSTNEYRITLLPSKISNFSSLMCRNYAAKRGTEIAKGWSHLVCISVIAKKYTHQMTTKICLILIFFALISHFNPRYISSIKRR